jgi:hypothetical protein
MKAERVGAGAGGGAGDRAGAAPASVALIIAGGATDAS